ncbi:MAG TPA: hypothetical protein VI997_11510 [Candidatus Thermoplasmatota archaeon]|nr:hypothetical protein [Candidatus Thermoplasmatota archaeon]
MRRATVGGAMALAHPYRPRYTCDRCGGEMLDVHCKLSCRRCGFVRDCSDP